MVNLLDRLFQFLPQIEGPSQKKLDFGSKLKWTVIVLVLYFTLKHIPLYGMASSALEQYQNLAVLLGAEFGSLISLGIGPIVTGSIILQLLNGSGIVKFDLTSKEGKARFQGTSKLFSYLFILIEAFVFVYLSSSFAPDPALQGTALYATLKFIIFMQVIVGGLLIILLDDLVQKWGLTSGISLFIAAGVAESLFVQAFSWLPNPVLGEGYFVGAFWRVFQGIMQGEPQYTLIAAVAIVSTVIIFFLVVFFQSMKVEIPLSFGKVRGFGMRWPLNFMYTSVIPVTLMAALLVNVQLGAVFLENHDWAPEIFGKSLSYWFQTPGLLTEVINAIASGQSPLDILGYQAFLRAIWYTIILTGGALLFSWFWMQTSGMDAASVAKQIMGSGLQIPGFRSDPRIMEHILNRYIPALTVMGGITIGLLSAFADILGSLTTGTGLLLAVMIVYRIYEDVARQHLSDMNPMMRQFMGKGN